MNTNEMYQAALKDLAVRQQRDNNNYGVSRYVLANGDEVICFIRGVAGRSIRAKHMRTEYSIKYANKEYSKPISRTKVVELLK